jgi:LuxR family transcriptional regulator
MPTFFFLRPFLWASSSDKDLVDDPCLPLQGSSIVAHYRQFFQHSNRKASMPMTGQDFELSTILGEFKDRAAAGYALGLHINFTTPAYFFQSYPRPWLDHYSKSGLLVNDPTVSWCFENTGVCRWSDLEDPSGILAQAAEHGMNYGIVYATNAGDSLSMSGFARPDREYHDDEIAEIVCRFDRLHEATSNQASLSADTVAQLKKMSIIVTHPGS